MLTRLLVLWLLSETSMHGYRIKRILDDPTLRFWFPVEFASIYGVLRTLERAGYVKATVEREGNRPERTRYAITRAGREHFRELLRRAWQELPSASDPLQLALAARPELDDEVGPLLNERVRRLRERLESLGELERSAPDPEMVLRQRALTEAELTWADALARGASLPLEEGGTMTEQYPDVQIISSIVVTRDDGRILLLKGREDDRWWLPGEDVNPYQHPDERAKEVLAEIDGLLTRAPAMIFVESFRGRRGWHVVFHYHADGAGEPAARDWYTEAEWFDPQALPRTAHGSWERKAVERVLSERARER